MDDYRDQIAEEAGPLAESLPALHRLSQVKLRQPMSERERESDGPCRPYKPRQRELETIGTIVTPDPSIAFASLLDCIGRNDRPNETFHNAQLRYRTWLEQRTKSQLLKIARRAFQYSIFMRDFRKASSAVLVRRLWVFYLGTHPPVRGRDSKRAIQSLAYALLIRPIDAKLGVEEYRLESFFRYPCLLNPQTLSIMSIDEQYALLLRKGYWMDYDLWSSLKNKFRIRLLSAILIKNNYRPSVYWVYMKYRPTSFKEFRLLCFLETGITVSRWSYRSIQLRSWKWKQRFKARRATLRRLYEISIRHRGHKRATAVAFRWLRRQMYQPKTQAR